MSSYSFRTAGPRLPSIAQLFALFAGGTYFSSFARSPSALDRALFAAAAGLGAAAFVASFWGLLVEERVSAAGDEFVLELLVCGAPYGPARRMPKADVLRAGLEKIEFHRWMRPGRASGLVQRYSGWSLTLYGRGGPSQSTRLPLNDADSDGLLAFVRGELGHD